MMPLFLLANWRILGLLAILFVTIPAVFVTRHQLALCRTEVAEVRGRYDLLLARVETQNAAVEALEQAGKEAAKRAAQERARAAGTIKIAEGKAASLEQALRAPRAASECPATEAVKVIRADLAAQ